MTTLDDTMIKRFQQFPCKRFGSAIVGLIVMFLGSGCVLLESEPPVVTFDREFDVLGRDAPVRLTIVDGAGGVGEVRIVLTQNGQEVVLVDEVLDEPPEGESLAYDLGQLIADNYTVQEGPASLSITVADGSLRENQAEITREFQFDLYPPRLEVMSGLLYINQGGSENVVYRVSEDAAVSGVQVGPHFFPGFPADIDGNSETHFALFAFAYNLPTDTPVRVIARDLAGNESVASVRSQVSALAFRNREIGVDDNFLQKVVPEIMSRTPEIRDQGSLIDTYVEINSRLRTLNHETITEISESSEGEFLWDGGFLQLSNSQVESLFADHRTYMYEGEEVDQQDHVGFDLSVVARYPIEATNAGRVILAEYFGIYGNAVLIDHGAGLISLYGHMSSFDVEPGQMVGKGEILGRSGETGLAGGDHLHFGLFLHGVPVNPIEWWDARWVQEHVLDRLEPPVE
jgi:murein DD-endopeptidase MepM/ murein hydrolase activator NlpD